MVTANNKEEAEERLREHPNLKDVVGLQIHSLEEQGDLDDIERRVGTQIEKMEAELPVDDTSNNNNKRKYLN